MKRGTRKWAKALGKKWLYTLPLWAIKHVAESQDGTPTLEGLRNNAEAGFCRDCVIILNMVTQNPAD